MVILFHGFSKSVECKKLKSDLTPGPNEYKCLEGVKSTVKLQAHNRSTVKPSNTETMVLDYVNTWKEHYHTLANHYEYNRAAAKIVIF